ncbi:hypothetical protein L209DRAFT_756428 [Thermothelomyces heterothallicus CBS 203.75]
MHAEAPGVAVGGRTGRTGRTWPSLIGFLLPLHSISTQPFPLVFSSARSDGRQQAGLHCAVHLFVSAPSGSCGVGHLGLGWSGGSVKA